VASRDVAAVTYSHEMAESITDPDLDGWYDDALGYRGEVGDVCQGHLALVGTYTIQQEWSNADGQCMAFRDVPLPPSGGSCPAGTVLTGGQCVGNGISWGCSSTAAGFPSLLALGLFALRRRRQRV
jgi:MYXO-CTERM domain-containing protein